MSYITDFKSPFISLFGVNGGNTSTDQSISTEVGQKFSSADGRTFVLVQNGGTALVSGVLVQSPASIGANHTGLTLSTAAIGATQITATLGGTLATANQYAGGYLSISAGTGAGQTLKIASHPAGTSSGTVVFTLEDPLSVATLTSDSKGSLTLPLYGSKNGTDFTTSGVVVCPTTATGTVIGATVYPIAASTATVPTYGWIQTSGFVSVLNQGTTAIGLDVMPSASVAGAVATYVVATRSRVGTSTVAGVDTKSLGITLQL
jgi:hypothetical protein